MTEYSQHIKRRFNSIINKTYVVENLYYYTWCTLRTHCVRITYILNRKWLFCTHDVPHCVHHAYIEAYTFNIGIQYRNIIENNRNIICDPLPPKRGLYVFFEFIKFII